MDTTTENLVDQLLEDEAVPVPAATRVNSWVHPWRRQMVSLPGRTVKNAKNRARYHKQTRAAKLNLPVAVRDAIESDNMAYGTDLTPEDQKYVLSAYVHRFTRNHKPEWANKEWKDGKPYPVQFDSDKEWLENTRFAVNQDGRLNRKVRSCYSIPTWPDNPELGDPKTWPGATNPEQSQKESVLETGPFSNSLSPYTWFYYDMEEDNLNDALRHINAAVKDGYRYFYAAWTGQDQVEVIIASKIKIRQSQVEKIASQVAEDPHANDE